MFLVVECDNEVSPDGSILGGVRSIWNWKADSIVLFHGEHLAGSRA